MKYDFHSFRLILKDFLYCNTIVRYFEFFKI